MTINKNINELLYITLGEIVSDVILKFTKTSTGRTEILDTTIISSSLRYLVLEVDTTILDAGEYSMSINDIKTYKVEVVDYIDIPEYNNIKIYGEYNGNI